MGIADNRLREAMRAAAAGHGMVWVPNLTTSQEEAQALLAHARDTSFTPAQNFYSDDMWLVHYRGDVQPDSDTPAWTEVLSGTVTHTTDGDVFTITDDTDAEYLFYYYTATTLDNSTGAVFEAKVRIPSSTGAANRGAAMTISDGTRQHVAWLRSGGVNIDGEDDVTVNMTIWRRVKLVGKGDGCQLFIDGDLRQAGSYTNPTVKTEFTFGSHAVP